jgi:hypothetical protein
MINSMDDINETNVKNLLHDASNLKLLCERRGLEKLDAEKRDDVEDMLRDVYVNGKLFNKSTFDEVRKRASL